jgi:hypothetical protein
VVNRKRYSGEVQSNIRTALQQRVEGLLLGQKAAVFDTRRSTPVAELLGRPAVVELQTLGDDDEKAFVMALLFALLAQHAEIRQRGLAPSAQRKLQHLTLIEEAHRLLSAVRPSAAETADPRGKAVSMFADLLAELRAYGEGFIIADQIPTKLAPETMKNTAVKIVHRLTAADDRQAMSACMDLSADQNRHLNRLAAGQAVFHDPSVGDALLIAVTPLERAAAAAARPQGGAARLSAQHYLRRGSGCEQCSSPCRWYGAVSENESPARAAVGTLALRADIEAVVSALLAAAPEAPPPAEDLWREEDAGWRYCASLFVARAHLRDRALVRCRAVGLSTLRARDMIDIERATTALGPVLLARVRAEAVSGSTWRSAADTLRVALAAVPPREWPGCAQCSVRCRALPIVAGHKDRAGALLALPRADQSAALRVDAFLTQAKKVPSLDAGALWCLAVQAVGEHFYEVNARSFMVVLREALR